MNIRLETKDDYEYVENMIRRSFYNVYMPGCIEHFIAKQIRNHKDFIKELDFVLEVDGKIVGNIMYTKSILKDEQGNQKDILTFGPVCIEKEYQRKGYGKKLIEYSLQKAKELGYDAIVIVGSPSNYVSLGFKSCKLFDISIENGKYPSAMLVKVLKENALENHHWTYYESPAMAIDLDEALAYDDTLEKMERKHMPSQDEFYIMSQSYIE